MRSRALSLVAAVCALATLSAAAESVSWDFVQSVGGLTIGQPVKSSAGWQLPIRADVSGLRTVTVQPKVMNSGIACVETRAAVEGSSIFLTVITGIASSDRSAACPPAMLGSIAPGPYLVKYRGGNGPVMPIGKVNIAL